MKNATIDQLIAQDNALGSAKLTPDPSYHIDTESSLCTEFSAWCDAQKLPQMSADELIDEDITTDQRKYLSAFIDRWEAMLERQGV